VGRGWLWIGVLAFGYAAQPLDPAPPVVPVLIYPDAGAAVARLTGAFGFMSAVIRGPRSQMRLGTAM
jgi:hypothetical protein